MRTRQKRTIERYPAAPNEPIFALSMRSEQGEIVHSAERYTLADAAALARAANERGGVWWITLIREVLDV